MGNHWITGTVSVSCLTGCLTSLRVFYEHKESNFCTKCVSGKNNLKELHKKVMKSANVRFIMYLCDVQYVFILSKAMSS